MRIALCALALIAFQLKAEMNVKEYRQNLKSDDERVVAATKAYIAGLFEGMQYATVREERTKQKQLFCMPGTLVLHTKNYIDVIEGQIKRISKGTTQAEVNQTPIAVLLGMGLEQTFPCDSK